MNFLNQCILNFSLVSTLFECISRSLTLYVFYLMFYSVSDINRVYSFLWIIYSKSMYLKFKFSFDVIRVYQSIAYIVFYWMFYSVSDIDRVYRWLETELVIMIVLLLLLVFFFFNLMHCIKDDTWKQNEIFYRNLREYGRVAWNCTHLYLYFRCMRIRIHKILIVEFIFISIHFVYDLVIIRTQ